MARKDTKDKPAFDPAERLTVMDVPLDSIDPHPENPRLHPDSQIEDISLSLATVGQLRTASVWDRGNGRYTMVAGHGLMEGAKLAGRGTLQVSVYPPETPAATIKAAMLSDNLHGEHSSHDETALARLLEEQKNLGANLRALGSSEDDLAALHERLANRALAAQQQWGDDDDPFAGEDDGDEADGPRAPQGDAGGDQDDDGQDGALLPLVRTDLYEPSRTVQLGDVWQMGQYHILACLDVFRDWPLWQRWLVWQVSEAVTDTPEPRRVVFLPFPDPLVPLGKRADAYRFVLVQPDGWICAHMIDHHVALHGEASLKQLATPREREQELAKYRERAG